MSNMGCHQSKPNNVICNSGIYIPRDTKDIKKFIPDVREGIVISVYDGDTITIATNFKWDKYTAYKFSVRLARVDCPEMRTIDKYEKQVARLSQLFVSNQLLNKKVTLHNVSYDKYGRILADVRLKNDTQFISDKLLEARLAVEYGGGKKVNPRNWLVYYNTGEFY